MHIRFRKKSKLTEQLKKLKEDEEFEDYISKILRNARN
jgi:hypothetical protein